MLEVLTGAGLASAAGLNAGLPLLVLGAAARWTDLVTLPVGWGWLADGWVLVILAVLVAVDMVADKVPGLDHVNDLVQTVVRPTAGGLAFGAGAGAQTVAVSDPAAVADGRTWLPVLAGVALAFAVHLLKALARPLVTVATGGLGTPVVSAAEDAASLTLTVVALLLPVLVLVVLGLLVWLGVRALRRNRSRRRHTPIDRLEEV